MNTSEISQPASLPWRLRDSIAATGLLLATAAVVLWQNAHVAVLWDLGYVLDTATRIAQGQMPYRDFPLAHAPLTFLVQAAIVRLTGRVFFHHALYVAVAGGLGSVLAWRIALRALAGRVAGAWWVALALAAPLAVVGIYCIFPHPSYDCDAGLLVLLALWLLQRIENKDGVAAGAMAGAALALPVFAKQNIGLPLLTVAVGLVVALLVVGRWKPERVVLPAPRVLLAVLAGAAGAMAVALALLAATAGLGNYWRWTMGFAAARRMPGLAAMAGVYSGSFLRWALPATVAGLLLLRGPLARRVWTLTIWARIAAFALLTAPWFYTLASLLLYDDADERGDALLALWPLVLVLTAGLILTRMVEAVRGKRAVGLAELLPLAALAAIHGTLMSQQLWGSTYALWPLFVYLAAELLAWVAEGVGSGEEKSLPRWFVPALAGTAAVTLAVCGGFYTASEERLNYMDLNSSEAAASALPELAGLATPGPYLADFDQLVGFAQAAIPASDTLLILPGEGPFYFATGRAARFPVTLFDPATDPYSPEQLLAEAQKRQAHWLIVKRTLQIKEDPTPDRAATMRLLERQYFVVARPRGYDVYHYAGTHPETHTGVGATMQEMMHGTTHGMAHGTGQNAGQGGMRP
ncbi:MAG: hypothetical protein P4K83_12565 [Terracidiphilus sp.]|nr:hypothetical protein [Terracidiphilus sp.]